MADDPNRPEVLVSLPTEAEGTAVVTDLAEYGIEARCTGGYISGFKAEAPSTVAVQVRSVDLDRARQALAEIRAGDSKVDWSTVDFSAPPEIDAEAEPADSEPPPWAAHMDRVILTLFVVGAAASLLVPLFRHEAGAGTSSWTMPIMAVNAAALLLLAWRMLFRG